jgi:hypothetical protein
MSHETSATFERPGVKTSVVLGAVFGFMAFAALAIGGLAFWYSHAGVNLFVPPRAFPSPKLETRHAEDIGGLLQAQTERARQYAWVDKNKGLIRIPISRAMEILASRGPNAYDPPDPPPAAASTMP